MNETGNHQCDFSNNQNDVIPTEKSSPTEEIESKPVINSSPSIEKESTEYQEDKTTLKKPRMSKNLSEKEKQFEQCLAMMENHQSPEKVVAGVVLLVRLQDTNEFTSDQVLRLKKKFSLLNIKSLLTAAPPSSQPKEIYLRPAMNLLMCYIPHCHGDADLYTFLPRLVDLAMARDHDNDDVVREAFASIALITSSEDGIKALIHSNIIKELCSYIKLETCHADLAMIIIRQCCHQVGSETWSCSPETCTELMEFLCRSFANEQNERSFDVCDALRDIVHTVPSDAGKFHWKKDLYKGLGNSLKSKLSTDFRNRSLLLASAVIDAFGVEDMCKQHEDGSELFVLMVSICCVEVRMSLEDKTVEEAIDASIATTGCYLIMELGIKCLVNRVEILSENQQQVLYGCLKEAIGAVLIFLSEASIHTDTELIESQIFVIASVRVLGAWIAEETTANLKEVYQLLPFIINLTRKTGDCFTDINVAEECISQNVLGKKDSNLLRFLLPGLCHLTAEDVSRKILLDLDIESMLMDYLMMTWNKANVGNQGQFAAKLADSGDPMITISNIFMNIVVQESSRIKETPIYYQLLRWLMTNISEIPIDQDNLHLSGCFATLGLLVLRNQHQNIPRSENYLFKFIQCAVRFLWDAYNIEESHDYRSLVVSSWYKPIWEDLCDLWYIGIHSLSIMLSVMPWLTEFLVDSEYPQALIGNLLLVKPDGIEEMLKCTYEEFFIALVKNGNNLRNLFILKGADKVCEIHNMKILKGILKL